MTRPSRRRRKDNLGGFKQRLGTAGIEKDTKNFAYRWVNEDNLIARTEEDDYDPVKRPGRPAEGQDNTVRRFVGRGADGVAQYAILCRKPMDLYRDDEAAVQASVDETMNSIRRGGTGRTEDADHTYIPKAGISIKDTVEDG